MRLFSEKEQAYQIEVGMEMSAKSGFTVLHWNVLASYLGRNTNPWFLHGISLLPHQRTQIFEAYFSRDPVTKRLNNPGWPSYVRNILNPAQIQKIEEVDALYFSWPSRFKKIKQILTSPNADVISLVELDCFDDLQPYLENFGYSGAFVRRPRPVSRDGCGVFWNNSRFKLLKQSQYTYMDRHEPFQDRCALLVLLEDAVSQQRYMVASTHLARDVFNAPPRDSERARQLGELTQHIRVFTEEEESISCIVCGDVNSTSIQKLSGLCQVSTLLSENTAKLHPFIFTSRPTSSHATTLTESRHAAIDAILYSSHLLSSQELKFSPEFEAAKCLHAPNDIVPSDHFPLLTEIHPISLQTREENATLKWWSTAVMKSAVWFDHESYLDLTELQLAFSHIDSNNNGYIDLAEALQSLQHFAWYRAKEHFLLVTALFSTPMDFSDFCALYFLAHPVCEECANFAFDMIDTSKNEYINLEELQAFMGVFNQTSIQGNAQDLFLDAERRGLVEKDLGLSRTKFKTLLGMRYVEKMFDNEKLKESIVNKMKIPALQESNSRGLL